MPASSCSAELKNVVVSDSVSPSSSAPTSTPGTEPMPASTVMMNALTVRLIPSDGWMTPTLKIAAPANAASNPATRNETSSTRCGSIPISFAASRSDATARTARPAHVRVSHHHRPAISTRLTAKNSNSLRML